MKKPTTTIDLLNSINKHLLKSFYPLYFEEKGDSDEVIALFDNGNMPNDILKYSEVFIPFFQHQYASDSGNAADLPTTFILTKVLNQNYRGDILQNGVLEVCLYTKNINGKTLPNLRALTTLTDKFSDKIVDAIFDNIAEVRTRSTIVSDIDIHYHYNSFIINIISLK